MQGLRPEPLLGKRTSGKCFSSRNVYPGFENVDQALALWENKGRPFLCSSKWVSPPLTAAELSQVFWDTPKELLRFYSSGSRCIPCASQQKAASQGHSLLCPPQRCLQGRCLPQLCPALNIFRPLVLQEDLQDMVHRTPPQRQMPVSRGVPA